MRHVGYKCSSNTATFPRQFELLRPSLAFDRASGQGASRLQRQFFHVNLYVQLHRARLKLRECLQLNWFGQQTA